MLSNRYEQNFSWCLELRQVEKTLKAELTKHMLALSVYQHFQCAPYVALSTSQLQPGLQY